MNENDRKLCERLAAEVTEKVSAITAWEYRSDVDALVVIIPLHYDRAHGEKL